MLLARIMYPTCIFDLLEDLATENTIHDHSKKIYAVIKEYELQLEKIKMYYSKIISMMNIRPINWLN